MARSLAPGHPPPSDAAAPLGCHRRNVLTLTPVGNKWDRCHGATPHRSVLARQPAAGASPPAAASPANGRTAGGRCSGAVRAHQHQRFRRLRVIREDIVQRLYPAAYEVRGQGRQTGAQAPWRTRPGCAVTYVDALRHVCPGPAPSRTLRMRAQLRAVPAGAVSPAGCCASGHCCSRGSPTPRSQPWWNSKSVAGVTANQSAPLGVTGIVAGDKYGPLFTWEKTEQQGGTVCHWSWDFQRLHAVESCTYPLNLVLNHSVVSTPPLAVYTSASSAVIEVFEDAATPLQLSMVNTSCGAAPCTGR